MMPDHEPDALREQAAPCAPPPETQRLIDELYREELRDARAIMSPEQEYPPQPCSKRGRSVRLPTVKLLLENLPPSLVGQRETLARCLEAMDRALPLRAVYLFGSHARGEARPDSDVDLCLVADGAERQLATAQKYRVAMRPIRAKPSFTLVPICPARLVEKQAIGDYFYQTVLSEGVLLATQN